MKKIMALLLMVSVVAGMTLPAMATDGGSGASAGSSSNGGTNKMDVDNSQTASNYAAHSVSVTLVAAPQTNNIGKNIAASGSVANGAIATFDGSAKAEDATSGSGASGSSGSGAATSGGAGASVDKVKLGEDNDGNVDANPEAETGNAKSTSKTGSVDTGDAKNVAKVADNSNSADANDNLLTSGNVDNHITQFNVQLQYTPVDISNDQKVVQKIKVDDLSQDANSEAMAKAISKPTTTTTTTTDVDTTTTDTDVHFDDSPIEVEL